MSIERGTDSVVFLNEAEQRHLDSLALDVDVTRRLMESAMGRINPDNLSEFTLEDAKEKGKKAWEALKKFFKNVIEYIQKKVRKHLDYLSAELDTSKSDEYYVNFYNKGKASPIKKIKFEKSDKLKVVLVANAFANMVEANKSIDKKAKDYTGEKGDIFKNQTDKENDAFNNAIDNSNPRTALYDTIKGSDTSELKKYIDDINKYYQKTIGLMYDISKKAVKNTKKNDKSLYKEYIKAKSIISSALNFNNLIKVVKE